MKCSYSICWSHVYGSVTLVLALPIQDEFRLTGSWTGPQRLTRHLLQRKQGRDKGTAESAMPLNPREPITVEYAKGMALFIPTHACADSERCIPKMDHHCPWTVNCVSHFTLPHFMRFLWYAVSAMCYLEYLLYLRAEVIWQTRNLPSVRSLSAR